MERKEKLLFSFVRLEKGLFCYFCLFYLHLAGHGWKEAFLMWAAPRRAQLNANFNILARVSSFYSMNGESALALMFIVQLWFLESGEYQTIINDVKKF